MKIKLFYIPLLILLSVIKLSAQNVANITQSTSYTTIQDAVDNANDSDELQLSVGTTYNEVVIIENKSILLTANQPSTNYTYTQITVKGIKMKGIGKTLTISAHIGISSVLDMHSGDVVVVSGYDFVLRSTAAGTALVINNDPINTVQGNVIMERYLLQGINGLSYRYFSSPFSDATISQFADDMNLVLTQSFNTTTGEPAYTRPFPTFMYYKEENAGFVRGQYYQPFTSNFRIPTALDLMGLRGYTVMIATSTIVDLNGMLNNGNFDVNITNSGGAAIINNRNDGFNLIGNLYASPIDWDIAIANVNNSYLDNTASFHLPTTQYQYNATNTYDEYGRYSNGIAYNGGKSQIVSMQGFFVRANDEVGNVEFTNENRIISYEDGQNSFLRVAQNINTTQKKEVLLEIILEKDMQIDKTTITFQKESTSFFDSKYDVLKKDSKNSTIYTYSKEDKQPRKYAINGLSSTDIGDDVYLGLTLKREGEYTLSIADVKGLPSNYTVYLSDATKDILHNLTKENYTFYSKEGKEIERFTLLLKMGDRDAIHPFSVEPKN